MNPENEGFRVHRLDDSLVRVSYAGARHITILETGRPSRIEAADAARPAKVLLHVRENTDVRNLTVNASNVTFLMDADEPKGWQPKLVLPRIESNAKEYAFEVDVLANQEFSYHWLLEADANGFPGSLERFVAVGWVKVNNWSSAAALELTAAPFDLSLVRGTVVLANLAARSCIEAHDGLLAGQGDWLNVTLKGPPTVGDAQVLSKALVQGTEWTLFNITNVVPMQGNSIVIPNLQKLCVRAGEEPLAVGHSWFRIKRGGLVGCVQYDGTATSVEVEMSTVPLTPEAEAVYCQLQRLKAQA